MNRPRVKNLLLPSARNETVGWEVGVYLHRLSEVVKIREDVWVVVLPVPALARGHLGRYDMARGWWIHLAADESRPLVGAPVLGQRLVDPSILGALRHELGHHVYARSGQLRAQ